MDIAQLLDPDEDARTCKEIPEQACREQPRNRMVHLVSLTLTKIGDSLVDAKLTLTWLLAALGAPAFMVAWLVPLRESLSLLPQLAVGQWIREHPVRKGFWIVGSLIQAGAILAISYPVLALSTGVRATYQLVEGDPTNAPWLTRRALPFLAISSRMEFSASFCSVRSSVVSTTTSWVTSPISRGNSSITRSAT